MGCFSEKLVFHGSCKVTVQNVTSLPMQPQELKMAPSLNTMSKLKLIGVEFASGF